MMKSSFLIAIILCCATLTQAQKRVNVVLTAAKGLQQTEYIQFYLSRNNYTYVNFIYDQFPGIIRYQYDRLYQYGDEVADGTYKLNVKLKSGDTRIITDDLVIDAGTLWVDVFITLGNSKQAGDYVKEIKVLHYRQPEKMLQFLPTGPFTKGEKAEFKIRNNQARPLYGFPDNRRFIGWLSEEGNPDTWSNWEPETEDLKYCDSTGKPRALKKGETAVAFAPNPRDCKPLIFRGKGVYHFELLFAATPAPALTEHGFTTLSTRDIYRVVYDFSIAETQLAALFPRE